MPSDDTVFLKLLAQLNETTAKLAQQYRHDVTAALLSSTDRPTCSAERAQHHLLSSTDCPIGSAVSTIDETQIPATPVVYEAETEAVKQTGTAFSGALLGPRPVSLQSPRPFGDDIVAFEVQEVTTPSASSEDSAKRGVSFYNLGDDNIAFEVQQILSPSAFSGSENAVPVDNQVDDGATCSVSFNKQVEGVVTPGRSTRNSYEFMRSKLTRRGSQKTFMMRHPWIDQRDFDHVKLSEVFIAEGISNRKLTHATSVIEQEALGRVHCYMLRPESKVRGLWVLACMAFLLYDLVMVPVNICFKVEDTAFAVGIDFTAMIFWTIDIFLTFITGVRHGHRLQMHPKNIACIYLKSWFLFDVGLVLPEWISIAFDIDAGDHVSIIRVLRWGRLTRLLRLARIVHFTSWTPVISRMVFVFNLSKAYMELVHELLRVSLILLVSAHVLSCFWYLLGSEDGGWVELNGLGSASGTHSYIVSLHWFFCRLHGLQSHNVMHKSSEIILDAVLVCISFVFSAYCLGLLAAMAITSANSEARNLWRMSIMYQRKYQISEVLDVKMNRSLQAHRTAGVKQQAENEMTLLSALPMSLRYDILFEVRGQLLTKTIFFSDLLWANARIVRQVCIDATTMKVFADGEVVWATGDAGVSMLFITSGSLYYMKDVEPKRLDKSVNARTLMLASVKEHLAERYQGRLVEAGSSISEPSLWAQWMHHGTLITTAETTALFVEPSVLYISLAEHRASLCHAVKYAQHFCWQMNQLEEADDLTQFPDLSLNDLEKELFEGSDFDHLMFLSHYKLEAGTEATLMRDAFEKMFKEDPKHPANLFHSAVFVDSEDLIDLATLKEHVSGSITLVLLLTPGVLTRPWCLVEIVTAVRDMVKVVPVEIQRPGSKYEYPNDEFYARLLRGQGLPPGAAELLEQEGISLVDVENALRQVFLKIALPFSPHKTNTIRQAELQDILKRCSSMELQNLREGSN